MTLPDFHTGHYAAFIWPAYAISALGLAWMVVDSLVRAGRWRARAEGRKRQEPT